ncbi:MAG: hypothetical protein AABZ06_10060 [Bdellovibrionota bacterium]
MAISFRNGAIEFQTSAIFDASIGDAMRVSISDPYLMMPVRLSRDFYIAGTIDLYPLEVAYQLADEIAAVFPSKFDLIEQSTTGSSSVP